MDRPELTPRQITLAQNATAQVENLRKRARDLEGVIDAFCSGRASEDALRRAISESQLAG